MKLYGLKALKNKKGIGNLSVPFLFLALLVFPLNAQAQEWKELRGEHFIGYYATDSDFTQKVLDKADVYYKTIAADLGYPRYSDFWTWDKRVKIYIFPDHDSYIKATGRPQWSDGMADYEEMMIASYTGSPGFTENVLPHEIAHLIFHSFLNFKEKVPDWLDEGVAQWWTTGIKNAGIQAQVKNLFRQTGLLTLGEVIAIDPRNLPASSYVCRLLTKDGTQIQKSLTPDELVKLFYLESASVIGFLRDRYGAERFTQFCREIRDGKSLDKALSSAYAEQLPGAEKLEKAWMDYLSE